MSFSTISCNKKEVRQYIPCLTKIIYRDTANSLNFPVIKVDFIDIDTIIGKKVEKESYDDVVFYAIGKDSGKYFWSKPNYFQHLDDTTSLFFSVSYFDSKDGMTAEAIENFLIKGGIGLVAGKDTLNIEACQTVQP